MRSGGKSRKQKTSSRHKSKGYGQKMLEGVKEAFHLKKPSEKEGSHKILEAATKHNSKTIEKLNKLLLKKTKKIEKYKSQHKKERRQSSSSSSDSSSSDDSKDDEINMMLHKLHLEAKMNDSSRNRQDYRQDYRQDHRQDYRQDYRQYNKNNDPYNFGETYDDTLYDDPSSFRNRSSLLNKRNARISFVVKRGYTTQNALLDFTVAQRNEITRYVNAFCRYLEEKMIIEQNVNKASIANSVIRVDVYMHSTDESRIKQSLATYSRSNPFPYQNYRLEVASVS